MSRETINESRIWCDGCGLTYLEIQTSVEIDAMQRCGWVSRECDGPSRPLPHLPTRQSVRSSGTGAGTD